jgi:hypothetical protein
MSISLERFFFTARAVATAERGVDGENVDEAGPDALPRSYPVLIESCEGGNLVEPSDPDEVP